MLKSILEYQDYRAYIQDYFDDAKRRSAMTWRLFAKQAGFASCSYLKLICQGKANLSEEGISQVAKAVGLVGYEEAYFRSLVHFNQAKKIELRQAALNEICAIAKEHHVRVLDEQMFDYFSSWLNPVIRELVPNVPKALPSELVRRLVFNVGVVEVKHTLKYLVNNGLLIQNEDGSYSQTEKSISTGNRDIASAALRNYHHQMGSVALETLNAVPVEERNFSNLILGVTKTAYAKILEEMAEFRRKVVAIATEEDGIDRVYAMNLQFFPLTHKNTSNPKRKKENK